MRSNKKLARALAGVMIGSQVLATVPITNVVPVFASEVNMNESTTSSKSVESTLIANAEDLGGDVVVTIPNKMTLALNSETKTLGASSEVYAKGICGVLDSLTVSVTSDKINFVNKNKATDTVEADVNFGTDNTAKWTADQLIDGLKDELALVKQPIKLETNKSSIKHVGDYQAEAEFNISLGDNRNNWEAQATSLFNYKEITEGDNKGTIQITGLTDEGASYLSDEAGADGLLDIPEVIEDKAVTEIGYSAFQYNNNVKTVNMPSTLKVIGRTNDGNRGEGAFSNCKNLKKVNLNDGLTTLGVHSFEDCTSLKDITIPSTVINTAEGYTYTWGPFTGSGIKKAIIQDGATEISSALFQDCKDLVEVSIPDSVSTIEEKAFDNCTSLPNVKLPNSLETLCQAFNNCTSLKEIVIPGTVKKLNTGKVWGEGIFKNSGIEKLVLEPGITNINSGAFKDSTSLRDVTLPEGLTTINEKAFENCTALTEITIPSTVNVDAYWVNESGVFGGSGLTTATVANGATVIPCGLFAGATKLETVNIADTVETLDEYVFENCSLLNNVTLPSNLKTIGYRTFNNCSALSEINLPEGLTTISSQAFANCTALTDITIPSTLINTNSDWDSSPFKNSGLTSVTIASGTTKIPYTLLSQCTSLTSVNIPDTVTEIDDYVFLRDTALTSLTIPSTVTNMNHDSIFESCSGLTEINYGGTIEAFKASGFRTKSTSQTITVHCSDGDYEVQ